MNSQPTLRTSQITKVMRDTARKMRQEGLISCPFYRMFRYSTRKAQPPSNYLEHSGLLPKWSRLGKEQKTEEMLKSTKGMMLSESWFKHTLLCKATRRFVYAAAVVATLAVAYGIGKLIYNDGAVLAEGVNAGNYAIEKVDSNEVGERYNAAIIGIIAFFSAIYFLKNPLKKALKWFEGKMEKRYAEEKRNVDKIFEELHRRVMERI